MNTSKLAKMSIAKLEKACEIHLNSVKEALAKGNLSKVQKIKLVTLQCVNVKKQKLLCQLNNNSHK